MKMYEVTIIGEISVEADNEIEAENKAYDEILFAFDSCHTAGIICLEEEEE